MLLLTQHLLRLSLTRQEIKLYSNAAERRKFEDLADIYSIIKVGSTCKQDSYEAMVRNDSYALSEC